MNKPKLKSSSKVVEISQKPGLPNSNPLVNFETLSWGPIVKNWVKSIALFVVLALILGVGLYAGLAGTIAYTTKIDNKFYAIARDTFVGNEIPADTIIYGSSDTEVQKDLTNKLLQGAQIFLNEPAVNNPVVVRVVAGPTVKIVFENDGSVTINSGEQEGTNIKNKIIGLNKKTNIIDSKYIVECEWGSCEKGTYFLLPVKNISGEVISLNKSKG